MDRKKMKEIERERRKKVETTENKENRRGDLRVKEKEKK